MNARDAIYSKIRRSLGVTGAEPARHAVVDDRLAQAPPGLIPRRGQRLDRDDRIELFAEMARAAQASVVRVGGSEEVPQAVCDYLRSRNLPQKVRMGSDPRLAGMPFADRTPGLEIARGPSDGNDLAALSHAFAGVAETGTLVLHSGADNPTTLNFLPDDHIVVVDATDIAGDMETVWGKLRDRFGKGAMPRILNMITGPSRSGDIEQKLLLGAHGPRALHIVVVG